MRDVFFPGSPHLVQLVRIRLVTPIGFQVMLIRSLLQAKVIQLEQSFTVLVQEFQQEKQSLEQSHTSRHDQIEAELQWL